MLHMTLCTYVCDDRNSNLTECQTLFTELPIRVQVSGDWKVQEKLKCVLKQVNSHCKSTAE